MLPYGDLKSILILRRLSRTPLLNHKMALRYRHAADTLEHSISEARRPERIEARKLAYTADR